MQIKNERVESYGIKITVEEAGNEIGRAYIYIMKNSLHDEPFGLLEDVFVDESFRGKGIGTELVEKIIETAREEGCYKLLATSRYERTKVHDLYERMGFKDKGKEFRLDIKVKTPI